jgi:hypothetical protein
MTTTSNAVAGIFIGENISNSSTTYIIWTSGQTNNDHENHFDFILSFAIEITYTSALIW